MRPVAFILVVLLLTLVLLMTGCPADRPDNQVGPDKPAPSMITTPASFGNGVCYFTCVKNEFGRSLADYLGKHPELEVSALALDPMNGSYNDPNGYFVVFQDKQP